MMKLETKIAQIQSILGPIVSIGRGPRHPTHPNHNLQQITDKYFGLFPQARSDTTYVEFMYQYSGLFIHEPQQGFVVDVFGFAEISSTLIKWDGNFFVEGESRPDEDGFLIFCDAAFIKEHKAAQDFGTPNLYLDNRIGTGFAFDMAGNRQKGIYRAINPDAKALDMIYFCASFDEWLQILIDTKGNMVS
jgi:hypothetical protein